jgi:hypothetical protein
MSVLGTLKSLFGFNEENQNDISSFDDAGMTLDEDPPKNTGATPTNDLDARAAQLAAVAANAEPGTYTDQNVINAQNTAGNAVIGVPPVNQTGVTNDGTTGTQTTGTQTGTQTTGGEIGVANTRGGGTAPPPGATPGIVGGGGINLGAGSEFVRVMPGQVVETTDKKGVKSKSIEDLIEIGGSGFDDDVYARKLRRQAAMPDLKNEDYYPNQPFSESRTAWGDPIFSGAGAQFPMAAYDAQRKARAQAELDEAKSNIMQLKIPEIKTGAYYNAIRSGFTQQVKDIVNDAVARTGGNYQKAKRILDQEGKLAQAQSEWQGTAKMIDEKADVATAYLKKVRENPGDLYFPFEGVTATTDFLNGMNEFANGRITPAQLNELDKRMVSANKWEKFKQENMGKLKPTDYIPTPEQLKNSTLEDREAFKAVQLDLGGKAPDFNTWLYTQKYTEAALPQVMDGIVQPFFDQEKTAAEQLVRPGEKLEDAKLRVARGIAALFGRQYSQGTVTQNRKSDTNINVNTGTTPSTENGVYFNTASKINDIIGYFNKNMTAKNIDKVVEEGFKFGDKTGSFTSDDTYVGGSIGGHFDLSKDSPNVMAFNKYVFDPKGNGTMQSFSADGMFGGTGLPEDLSPTSAKIKKVIITFGVPDPNSAGGYRVITKNAIRNGDKMPENAVPIMVRQDLLTYDIDQEIKKGSEGRSDAQKEKLTDEMLAFMGKDKAGKTRRKITKVAYVVEKVTPELMRQYDQEVSRKISKESGGPGNPADISTNNSSQSNSLAE